MTIVEKDAPATAISIGAPIHILRGQPDWYPLAVANSWLGEHRHSGSHLYQVIREVARAELRRLFLPRTFRQRRRSAISPAGRRPPAADLRAMASLRASHEAGHFALRVALRELKHMVDHGLSAEDFACAERRPGQYVSLLPPPR